MNREDFAIVVGISKYPLFGESPETAADLGGPANDAEAVAAWLAAEEAGALPAKNIKLLTSVGTRDQPKPTPAEINHLFTSFDEQAEKNIALRKGPRIGRRLYVYMSGHGFSPKRSRGCLYSADATARAGWHVPATGWLDWLQESGYFDEFVLWMDCCMNRRQTLPESEVPFEPRTQPRPPGPTFIAFAARRPLRAVECEIAEGEKKQIRGVFTWSLLQGLRGAAADSYGKVTARSLALWLRNAQRAWMREGDLTDRRVSQEPEIIKEDDGLIFARGVKRTAFAVRLLFPPDAVGKVARLWSGHPPTKQVLTIEAAGNAVHLEPGLYLVDVPEASLRHGFEVLRPGDVVIEKTGSAARSGDEDGMFNLEVDSSSPGVDIFIIDAHFGLVDRHKEKARERLPRGLYKLKTSDEQTVREEIILLDDDYKAPARPEPAKVFAAPIPGSRTVHEYHELAVIKGEGASTRPAVGSSSAELTIMARTWTEGLSPLSSALSTPWEGLTVVDGSGSPIADLAKQGRRNTHEIDPYAICTLPVAAGASYLRQQFANGQTLDQSLIIPKGWRLELYELKRVDPKGSAGVRRRLSMLMRKVGSVPQLGYEETLIERALIALSEERRILGPELEELLLRKFETPMAGIVGALLLIVENERSPSRDLSPLNEVVGRLRRLVGRNHPDVEAISLRCPDEKLRRIAGVTTPPMFLQSWELLVQASRKRPGILPFELWERVVAVMPRPPYFAWGVDEETKRLYRSELARSIWQVSERHLTAFQGTQASSSLAREPRAASAPRRVARADLADRRAVKLQIPQSALEALRGDFEKESD